MNPPPPLHNLGLNHRPNIFLVAEGLGSRRRLRSRTGTAGFTLIEIMMALAIFSLVLISIYACWTLVVRSSQVAQKATAKVQRQRVAVRTIEEALFCARSFAADLEHYGFEAENGDDARLSFAANLPQSFPRSGKFGAFNVRRVIFELESAPAGGRQLVMRQHPVLMDLEFDQDEIDHPLVLARGVEKMEFKFWDTRKSEWAEEWSQTNSLPPMIMVLLEFGDPDQRYNYSAPRDEVARIVKLPTITVPAYWQTPSPPAGTPAPIQPITPVRPGSN